MNITRWIKAAKAEAYKSKISEWSIGAVIVKGSKVVGRGYNKTSSDVERFRMKYGFSPEQLWSLHAEMAALMDADEDLEGAVLFVSGFKSKNGNKICCKPCKACRRVLRHSRIEKVFYTDRDGIHMMETG